MSYSWKVSIILNSIFFNSNINNNNQIYICYSNSFTFMNVDGMPEWPLKSIPHTVEDTTHG